MRSRHMQSASSLTPPSLYDRWFIGIVACLIGIGLIMMASASIVISDHLLHQPFYFLFKQLIFITIGLIVGGVVLQVETQFWEKVSVYLLFLILLMLALVLLPGIGHRTHGSARWIGYGPLLFQVSELAKAGVIIYMAGYLVRRREELCSQLSGFAKPMIILTTVAI